MTPWLLWAGCEPKDGIPPGFPPESIDTATPSPIDTAADPTAPTGSTGEPADTGDPSAICGELASAVAIGGPGEESTQVLAAAPDGGLFVGGSFFGTLPLDPGGPAETTLVSVAWDGMVLRYGPAGELLWARQLASDFTAYPESIAPTSDGGAAVAGAFWGSTTFAAGEPDAVTLVSAGDEDGFVARFDGAGALLWVKAISSAASDVGVAAVVLADDSPVVSGQLRGDATFGAGEPGVTTLTMAPYAEEIGFVARFAAGDGALVWAEGFGGTQVARGDGLGVDPLTGELVVGGALSGPGVATFPGAASLTRDPVQSEAFLARWDPAGGATSLVTFGGFLSALDVGVDGTVFAAGDFSGDAVFGAGEPAETTLSSVGWHDAFAAAFAPDGTLKWAVQTESPRDVGASGRDVVAALDGGLVLSGDGDALALGPVSFTVPGAYLARFGPDGSFGCAVQVKADHALGIDVVRVGDDTFVSTGDFTGTAIFGAGASAPLVPSSGGDDGYLASWVF